MSTIIQLTFGTLYLTVVAVVTVTSVSTGLVIHLRNRDVRAQYAYIRSWAERSDRERGTMSTWATQATSAWRRLYVPTSRREQDYVWPTPEPWPAEFQAEGERDDEPATIEPADLTTVDERYRTLSPAVIEANAQHLLDTVAWPDLSEQIADAERARTGRHRADRR